MFKLTSDWGSNGYRQWALDCILSKKAKSTELSRSDRESLSVDCCAAPSMRRREFYCEEIDQRTSVSVHHPLTTKDLVDSAQHHVFNILYFILLVLTATFVCVITERHVPLVCVLSVVSTVSVVSFHKLNLWTFDIANTDDCCSYLVKFIILQKMPIKDSQETDNTNWYQKQSVPVHTLQKLLPFFCYQILLAFYCVSVMVITDGWLVCKYSLAMKTVWQCLTNSQLVEQWLTKIAWLYHCYVFTNCTYNYDIVLNS